MQATLSAALRLPWSAARFSRLSGLQATPHRQSTSLLRLLADVLFDQRWRKYFGQGVYFTIVHVNSLRLSRACIFVVTVSSYDVSYVFTPRYVVIAEFLCMEMFVSSSASRIYFKNVFHCQCGSMIVNK